MWQPSTGWTEPTLLRFFLSLVQKLSSSCLWCPHVLPRMVTASLSLSSLRSEDRKEVFLAIQVDGVTRARTAPLALRGPALSLNHAFHLELERAQLLRIILLTPGELQNYRLRCCREANSRESPCCVLGVSPAHF